MSEEKKMEEVPVVPEIIPEITKIQFERDLANKKEELLRAELSVAEHKVTLAAFNELLPVIEETMEGLYTPENCVPTKPVFKFETERDYARLIAGQKKIEQVQLYYTIKDKSIKPLVDTIKAKEDNIVDLKEKISKMESE